jgi:aminomethyltransferase
MMARIEAGLIMGGLEYDETSTPWECRMGWAVDLTKPEFQGKAALAASKGKAKQTVVSIAFPAGAEGLDGAEITVGGVNAGGISMAIPSPALDGKMLALARIDKAHALERTAVSVAGNLGTVVKMPVYDPERKRTRG